MSTEQTGTDVEALRRRLAEYEEAFAATAPRLAAFKQLEDLARLQKSTPEAVAITATLDILRNESADATTSIEALRVERDALQSEVSLLLIQKKTHDDRGNALKSEVEGLSQTRDQLKSERDALHIERDALVAERDGLLAEQETVVSHRREIELEQNMLAQRQNELRSIGADLENSLHIVRSEIETLMGQRQSLQTEVEGLSNELHERRREYVAQPESAAAESPQPATKDEYDFDGEVEESDSAFERFFDADVDHDKSRDWILK